MTEGGDKSSWIDLQELIWLLIRVNFNVLIAEAFDFKGYPDPLYKRATSKTPVSSESLRFYHQGALTHDAPEAAAI